MSLATPSPARWNGGKRSVVAFDVNETLVDIEMLSPLFNSLLFGKRVLRESFGRFVLYLLTTGLG